MKKGLLLGTVATIALAAASAQATPTFVNGIAIPGSTLDASGDAGLSGRMGFFSDIYYDPNANEWWALADRGPGGGTIGYETRVERFSIDINPNTGAISNFQVKETVKFTDPNNLLGAGAGSFNGLAPNPKSVLGRSLDPEGFVIDPHSGRMLVSDEYGPSVYLFNRDGTLAKVFKTPDNLIPRSTKDVTTAVKNFADDTGNNFGKRTNRGFEGLAITPDGKFAFAMLQSAMLDEGAGNGRVNRIVKFDMSTGLPVAQFAYKMEGSSEGRGISSLVALNDHEFLVLERNNRGVGVDSNLGLPTPSTNVPPDKKVFKIDLTGASDVTTVTLPADGSAVPGVTYVTKIATPFIDLTANTLAALGNRPPEKLEGLAIGPKLNGNKYLILAGTDNDFSVTQDATGTQFDELFNKDTLGRIRCTIGTKSNCTVVNANGNLGTAFTGDTSGFDLIPGVLYAYVADGATDLATYVAPVSEPGSLALIVSALGLAGLGLRRRRA